MNQYKMENKIKDLNSKRAMQKKYLREIEKKYHQKEISESHFIKHKQKIESKIEKIIHQIRHFEVEMGHIKHE